MIICGNSNYPLVRSFEGIMMLFVIVLILVALVFFGLRAMSRKELVCKDCGYIGMVSQTSRGSILIEIVLWLCVIVPGLIYSIWRMSNKAYRCPGCSGWNMIPTSTPIGQKLVSERLTKSGN